MEVLEHYLSKIDKKRLRASYEMMRLYDVEAIARAYDHLFTDFPKSTKSFEGVDMNRQFKAMLAGLDFVTLHLDKPNELLKYLEQLGARHDKYGAEPENYEWVKLSAIKAIAFYYGHSWSVELEQDWTNLYDLMKHYMLIHLPKK